MITIFDLLRAEIFKLRFTKTLPILCIIMLGIAFISAIVTYMTAEKSLIINGQLAIFQSPITVTYMMFFVSVLATEIIVSEYSNSTIKNLVATGRQRVNIYFSKLITLYAVSIFFCLLCIIAYGTIYTAVFGWGGYFLLSDFLAIFVYHAVSSVLILGVCGIVSLLSVLFQNPVAVISFCIGLSVAEIVTIKIFEAVPFLQVYIRYRPVD